MKWLEVISPNQRYRRKSFEFFLANQSQAVLSVFTTPKDVEYSNTMGLGDIMIAEAGFFVRSSSIGQLTWQVNQYGTIIPFWNMSAIQMHGFEDTRWWVPKRTLRFQNFVRMNEHQKHTVQKLTDELWIMAKLSGKVA